MKLLLPVLLIILSLPLPLPLPLFAQNLPPGRLQKELPGELSSHEQLANFYVAGNISLPEELTGNVVKISMVDAVRIALEQNLDLQAATYGARAADAALRGSYGLYDPVLSVGFLNGDSREQINSFFSPASSINSEYEESSIAILQRLPIGTELSLSGTMREEDVDVIPAPPINPSYDSQLKLSLIQPLLKGFGQTVTEQQIIFAAKDQQIALQDLRFQAFQVVAKVRNAYLDTLQAQYELSYRESSVELAKRIVRENNARVAAGILAPVEKLEAEVGLQTRERLLLDSQRTFADALDLINLLLDAKETVYLPVFQEFTMQFATSEEDGVRAGLLKRPDVIRRLQVLEKIRTERSIAQNRLLPELNLLASYGQSGLSDSSSNSFAVVKDGDYDSWEMGVTFSYPLGSIESRNELKRVEIVLKQKRSLLAQLRNEVRNEVRAAIRNINVNRKKTKVAKRGHDLAREKLRILLKSREAGLSTTRDVLDGEEDLAISRTDQITSVADYFKSITDYLSVTGTLLENENIIFSGDYGSDGNQPLFQLAQ